MNKHEMEEFKLKMREKALYELEDLRDAYEDNEYGISSQFELQYKKNIIRKIIEEKEEEEYDYM